MFSQLDVTLILRGEEAGSKQSDLNTDQGARTSVLDMHASGTE